MLYNFTDTIFLKDESQLEPQIEEMKNLLGKGYDDKKINWDINCFEKGKRGEEQIAYELKHSNIGMYVLRDVNFTFEDLCVQIDFVVVTSSYCYLIECKNMNGNISVNSDGQFSKESYYNGKKIREGMDSPYGQSVRHLNLVKKWLMKNVKTNLTENEFYDNYKPLIVFSNKKGMLFDYFAPKEVKDVIVRIDNLLSYLETQEKNSKKENKRTQEEMFYQAKAILSCHTLKERNFENKYKIKDDFNLKVRLVEFRTEKSKKYGIPSSYIFNNDELDKLMEFRPKTKEILENLKIIEDIKLKLHGDEIIDIINSVHNV